MTTFLTAQSVARIVREVGLPRFWRHLVDYLRADFEGWERFRKTPRDTTHSPLGVIELMPTSDGETYSFKYVNGHPGNAALGLQTVVAFGVLADVATGYPRLLADMTLATALRTAATSALAALHLARSDSRTMAIIGLGAQSEFQASAFQAILGVDQLRVFDKDRRATSKFLRNMSASSSQVTRCANARDATLGADIITTITADKKSATILSDAMVEAGTHINAVGGDCPGKTELARELLLRSRIVVEYEAQTRIEGDIQQLRADHPVTELWEIVSGHEMGRTSAQEITVFDSVGFAVEDFSILRLMRDLAKDLGAGEEIDLLAAPEDPKNLYALLRPSRNEEARRCG